jgi:hypothetical protein
MNHRRVLGISNKRHRKIRQHINPWYSHIYSACSMLTNIFTQALLWHSNKHLTDKKRASSTFVEVSSYLQPPCVKIYIIPIVFPKTDQYGILSASKGTPGRGLHRSDEKENHPRCPPTDFQEQPNSRPNPRSTVTCINSEINDRIRPRPMIPGSIYPKPGQKWN